jgi:hypothetical protein
MTLAGLIVAQDLVTAVCGCFNAAYFGGYWANRAVSRGRRLGATALALVSLAAVVEALFSEGLLWSQRGLVAQPPESLWALVRFPLFLATLLMFAIVVRRLAG